VKQANIFALVTVLLTVICNTAFGYDPYTGRFQQQDPVGTGPRMVSGPYGPRFIGLNGPTPPNPNAQTVQGIPIAHIQATITHNPKTAAAFNAIGASQYDDGLNAYQYTGSNPVNRIDPMGLAWYVNRNGGVTASAWPIISPDTVKELSSKIGLEYMEFKKWLVRSGDIRTEDGIKTFDNLLGTDKICPNQKFSIPNTVLTYWAGELGWLGRGLVNWERDTTYLQSLGFATEYNSGQTASGFESYLYNKTASKELHGIFFWGHGYPMEDKKTKIRWWDGLVTDHYNAQTYLNNDNEYDDFTYLSRYVNWHNNVQYRLGLGLIYACGGKHSMPGNFSSNSIHWGPTGVMIPVGTPPVSDFIKPGDQGTYRW
jgi:hypothetical protein